MYDKKIIVVVALSGLVTMIFLLFSVTITITSHQQEASTFFHEKLVRSSRNADAQLTTDIKPTNPPTIASSKQNGTPGDDIMRGSDQNDVLRGLTGKDIIMGEVGNDNLDGSEGNDYIIGGEGGDTLKGAAGNDTLIGGPGADTLDGGLGQDKFICAPGNDTILDFNATQGDIRSKDCEDNTTNNIAVE
jgi:Ca2+-binding RTX toxin-like protein